MIKKLLNCIFEEEEVEEEEEEEEEVEEEKEEGEEEGEGEEQVWLFFDCFPSTNSQT